MAGNNQGQGQTKAKQQSLKTKPRIERTYKKEVSFQHDLFKLNVANMQRNEALAGQPVLVGIEHCHFFHTVDSDGKKHIYSTPTGGHFHKMEVIDHGDGGVPEVKCVSGPLKWATQKVNGRPKKVAVPANDHDGHTHELTYIGSDEISIRKKNTEAAQAQAELDQAPPMPSGVVDES